MLVSISREPNTQQLRLDVRAEGDDVRGDARAYVAPGSEWLDVSFAVLEQYVGRTMTLSTLQSQTAHARKRSRQ